MRQIILYILILISSVLINNNLFGQKVLFQIDAPSGITSSIGSFDLKTCKIDTVLKRIYNPPPSPLNTDLTITPKGMVYANSFVGMYLQKIGKFNGVDFGVDSLHYELESYYYPINYPFDGVLALQSDEKGNLFCANVNLWKYNPSDKSWKYRGTFPDLYNVPSDSDDYFKYVRDGTLTKRDGEYYYLTTGKHKNIGKGIYAKKYFNQKMGRLDTLDASNSVEVFEFGDTVMIGSMFTIRKSCDKYNTYVFYYRYQDMDTIIPDYWAFGEVDFETGKIDEICKSNNIQKPYNLLFQGAAVPWTVLDNDCIVIVDLDLDNSSGADGKYDFRDTLRCKYDSVYISDIDPEVFSKTYIDSLQIFFVGLTPDGANEYLEVSNPGGLGINWQDPKHVTLINNTTDDFLPLEVAVRSVKYRNTLAIPTFGERKIAFVAFSGKRQSDTAYAYLELIDDFPNAGRDTIYQMCIDDTPIELNALITGDKQGQWLEATTTSGKFDPQNDVEGVYNYVVSKIGCGTDTAKIDIEVNELPIFDLGTDTMICKGEVIDLTCEIDADFYIWQDGSTSKNYTVQDSGLYILEVVDKNGCIFSDSIKVEINSSINSKIELDTTICQGDQIFWNNLEIDTAGDFEYHSNNVFGCDSLTILHVSYNSNENTLINIDTAICQGDQLYWNNLEIDTAGDFEYHSNNIFGCDSLTILHVSYYPLIGIEISGETMFCQGESLILNGGTHSNYQWSTGATSQNVEVSNEGWYYLEVIDDNGCLNIDSAYVTQIESLEIEAMIINESCYKEEDGSISLNYIQGGVGQKKYFIDGNTVEVGEELTGFSPGSYTLEVVDSLGCRWIEEVVIDSATELWLNLGADITLTNYDTELILEATNNFASIDDVLWYVNDELIENGELLYKFSPKTDTKIEVLLTDANGCEVRDTINIKIQISEEVEVYIPNIFTPNGDGMNDDWMISDNNQIEQIEYLAIYDRWGNQVFKKENIPFTSNSTNLWDGRYKDQPVGSGVYVYHTIFRLHNGKTFQKSGDITVIR